jgi:hypothetical protein
MTVFSLYFFRLTSFKMVADQLFLVRWQCGLCQCRLVWICAHSRLSEILEFLSESVIITELSSTKSALFNTIYRLYSDLNCTFMVLIKISWVFKTCLSHNSQKFIATVNVNRKLF